VLSAAKQADASEAAADGEIRGAIRDTALLDQLVKTVKWMKSLEELEAMVATGEDDDQGLAEGLQMLEPLEKLALTDESEGHGDRGEGF